VVGCAQGCEVVRQLVFAVFWIVGEEKTGYHRLFNEYKSVLRLVLLFLVKAPITPKAALVSPDHDLQIGLRSHIVRQTLRLTTASGRPLVHPLNFLSDISLTLLTDLADIPRSPACFERIDASRMRSCRNSV